MTVLDDFRQKYPQYQGIPDGKLAAAIRKKYYADMPPQDFYRKAGLAKLVGLTEKPETGVSDSGWENFRAGQGKSVMDNLRGAGQAAANIGKMVFSPEDVLSQVAGLPNVMGDQARAADTALRQGQTEANASDAPLMATKSGIAGNISGQAMQAIGAGTALKGAGVIDSMVPQTYRGAALAGAAQGAVQPLDNTQGQGQRLLNAGIGAGAGVVGQAIPAVIGGGVRTLRSLIDPLTDSGQSRIIANTINRFGQGGNMAPEASAVPGVQPTLAEATGNAGIGQLQRAVTDAGAGDGTLNQFVQRGLENNAARVNAVRGVTGTPDDLEAALAQRTDAANVLYDRAGTTDALRRDLLTQKAKDAAQQKLAGYGGLQAAHATESNMLRASPGLEALAQRPGFQQAIQQAKKLAADKGVNLDDPLKTVQGLHYVKLALDDMMQPNAASAMGRNQQAALQGTKQALLSEIEKISPTYAEAKDVFQSMSKPVNAMQTGQAFLDKAATPVVDALGNPTLTPARYMVNLNKLDDIAKRATGFKGATADDVFTPDQLNVLQAVGGDLSKKATSESAGRSAGSNTVQNLASQSLLGEVSKSTGLNLQGSGIIARLVKPLDAAYKLFGAPEEIRGKLAQLMLNPTSAESQKILSRIPAAQRPAFERALAPYTGFVGQQAGVRVGK